MEAKKDIEIIGAGYDKSVNIGDSYIKESVVNMWDLPPDGAFVYFSENGCQMILQEYTKTGEGVYRIKTLLSSEITEDIKIILDRQIKNKK